MAGLGNYEKGKAFSLKSGNKPQFKMMGSSPLKQEVKHIKGTSRKDRLDYESGGMGLGGKKVSPMKQNINPALTTEQANKLMKKGGVKALEGKKLDTKMQKAVDLYHKSAKAAKNRAKSVDKNKKELARGKKASPVKKAGCTPGDPGCGGNFKIKKKGTVVSRFFKDVGRKISVASAKRKTKRRIKKSRNKKIDYSNDNGGSHKTPRYL